MSTRQFHHFVQTIFKQPKQLNLVPRFPRSTVQYDSSAAGYGELCVWFYPIRNGELFWMNNNINFQKVEFDRPGERSPE